MLSEDRLREIEGWLKERSRVESCSVAPEVGLELVAEIRRQAETIKEAARLLRSFYAHMDPTYLAGIRAGEGPKIKAWLEAQHAPDAQADAPCSACGGHGLVNDGEDISDCRCMRADAPTAGEPPTVCPECDGTGKVLTGHDLASMESEPCEDCEGTGDPPSEGQPRQDGLPWASGKRLHSRRSVGSLRWLARSGRNPR